MSSSPHTPGSASTALRPQPAPPTGRRVEVALVAMLVVLVAFCALRPIWDIDIFWHVAVGRWIVDNLALPDKDLWSAADPGAPWQSFQWLYQALVAALDQRAGLRGVRIAHAVWVAGTFVLAWRLLRRRGLGLATTAALVLTLLVVWHDRMRVRPHIINLTAWLLIAAVVDRPDFSLRRAAPIVALGFLLWSALHLGGAFIAVCMLAGLSMCVFVLSRWRGPSSADMRIHVLALAALGGWILCPGAAGSLEFAAGQHGGSVASIPEWRSWWEVLRGFEDYAHPNMAITLLVVPVAGALVTLAILRCVRALRAGEQDPDVARPLGLLLALPLLAMAALWIRFAWMAWPAGLLAASWLWRRAGERGVAPQLAAWATAAVMLAVTLHYTTIHQFSSVGAAVRARGVDVDARQFPAAVTSVLASSGVEGRVAVPAAWGGYILYYAWPALRVTVDGRLVAPPRVLQITDAIAGAWARPEAAAALPPLYAALPADFLVMPHPAFRTADTGEWVPVVSSPIADLYARRGPLLAGWMAQLGRAPEPR